ncbi:MAG: membrane protein insertion efficiency factor YidD [Clostridiales bacterium]|nr:membrane protein insertion efficiency factor YidD [Clostridiales bacterium]
MKNIAMFLIKIYQKLISPLFPKNCKYYPTCSQYAFEAFKKHGFFKGIILSIWRILRCNPWSKGGVDKVPEKFYIFKRKRNC